MTHAEDHKYPPEWLNNAFIENALKKGLKLDDLEVLETDIKMAAAPGDNYASSLFRCNLKIQSGQIESKTKNISVIVKVIPSGVMGEELRKFSAFEKEAEFLSVTFPMMCDFLKAAYPNEEKLGPDFYYQEGPPNNLIIMEDLKLKGFAIANRMEGLDMDHAVLVLKALGKYHAVSLVLRDRYPRSTDSYLEGVWSRKNFDMMKNFLNSVFTTLCDDILTWKDFDKRAIFHEKMKKLEVDLTERLCDIFEAKDTKLKVLLHGDSWVNNFMFRHDLTGKPVEMKFIDFQLVNVNSPVIDLQYFIFSSTREDLRFTQVDAFLKIYHDSFTETLRRLDFKLQVPYELEDLKEEFDKMHLWGFAVLCCIFPLFTVPSDETMSPEELIEGKKDKFQCIFRKKNFQKVLTKGLLYFDKNKVF